MKVKKKPMSLLQKTFYVISFAFLIVAFIYLGTKNYNVPLKKMSDQESFNLEYEIIGDNVFKYKSAKEILNVLDAGSAVIFMAYPENTWSKVYAKLLNDVANNNRLEEIYYYNFRLDRSNNNHYYESIVEKVHSYLPVFDFKNDNLYAPTLLIVKDGSILYYDDETAIVRGKEDVDSYWSNDKKKEKIVELNSQIQKFMME